MTILFISILSFFSISQSGNQDEHITIKINPDNVLAAVYKTDQEISFDFHIINNTTTEYRLGEIRMKAFDADGKLMYWKKIDSNGSQPSILVLGSTNLPASGYLYVFNPFQSFNTTLPIEKLSYEFYFGSEKGRETVKVDVLPNYFQPKTKLSFPVRNEVAWIYDGSDYYSHHRRANLEDPMYKEIMKSRGNSQRYGLDISIVKEDGKLYDGDPSKHESWFGYGHPIQAPAPGKVVAMDNSRDENIPFNMESMKADPVIGLGNYIIIDHENGEFSLLGHFKKGSIKVKTGDRIKAGVVVGEMGRSGMGVGLVHLHYELRTSSDLLHAEGLPSYFDKFELVLGSKKLPVTNASARSGSLLMAK